MSNPSKLPAVEAIIRWPLGELRVWLDPADGQTVRTSLRLDYAGPRGADPSQAALGRVATQVDEALRGLDVPRTPSEAQAGPFQAWLTERTVPALGARTLARDLFADYALWCAENDAPVMSQRAFGSALSDRQFTRAGKSVDGLIYRGGLILKRRPDVGPAQLAAV